MRLALPRAASWLSEAQNKAEAQLDEYLVAAARSDPLAFAPLYQRYLNPIYRFCYARLGERQAAEDATSQVFLNAFANLHRFQGGVFAAWLYTIARNVVIDHHRKRRPVESLESADRLQTSSQTANGLEEYRIALLAALEELPDEQRIVLELQAAGWSGKQIAAALGKSPSAIRVIRYRAVKQLQKLLDPERKA